MNILIKGLAAILMMAALLLLVSGNYWAYGFKKEKKMVATASSNNDEQNDDAPTVPNPTEEKTSNGLQNISEYLHDHLYHIGHPVTMIQTGYHSSVDPLPVHHPELLTPPPKRA